MPSHRSLRPNYRVLDDDLIEQLTDPEVRGRCLVLSPHPDFPGHWLVDGFTKDYLFDLEAVIGSYRAIAPSGMGEFIGVASRLGYWLSFFEDPATMLGAYQHLNVEPEVSINSTFPNTVNGMLPYQVQGYNMLKDLDYGVARWDTGTGKTVLAAALAKYHWAQANFDICFFVVKKNNKVNTVRKLRQLADLDALYITGSKQKREQYYAKVQASLRTRGRIIVVMNYEQFRTDFVTRNSDEQLVLSDWGELFFPGRDLMFVWDEMPTKLKTRTSELYKSICKCIYRTAPPQVSDAKLRPHSMRAYMLSATPIENSPEDWFNCLRMMDGGRTYGTVTDFENAYVKSWSFYDPTKPADFHNFERMRLKAAHCVHQVSKKDPDIAAVFPKAVEELVYIDWDDRNAAMYNQVQDLAEAAAADMDSKDVPIFSLIGTLQMLCDAPEMVTDSAARREVYEDALEAWEDAPEGRSPQPDGSDFAFAISDKLKAKLTNEGHPKFERLRELLVERHPEAQVAIYSKLNQTLMPYLEAALTQWGVTYGRYTGTERQRQVVQDAFQAGEMRVFLASDSGSDSIDLDAGNVVIDYNLPWKWTTLTQRHNRVHRPTSNHDTVYYYTLLMAGSVEERVLQIIEKKRGYHNELFDPAAGDFSASARLTKEDLMYILTGKGGV